jgi:hypothetical protein
MESLLPFLHGTCTPYNMPVYPGAQRIIAESLAETSKLFRTSGPRSSCAVSHSSNGPLDESNPILCLFLPFIFLELCFQLFGSWESRG